MTADRRPDGTYVLPYPRVYPPVPAEVRARAYLRDEVSECVMDAL